MRRPGRRPVAISGRYVAALEDYTSALADAPLSEQTRRTYASKVRQFLAWLAGTDVRGDPLGDVAVRDWAVRDYRTHLQAVAKRKPATVNNALASVDDFFTRRGLGPAKAARAGLPRTAPRALARRSSLEFLREVERWPAARDRAIALTAFYAGARISEIVRLDIDDVALSARKGTLRLYGKADKVREVPIHPPLRAALTEWLRQRRDWRAAATSTALFPNQKGGRLSATSASNIIAAIAAEADPDGRTTAHVLRHTFATSLVRGGTDLVTVAELLGHARLETVRAYTRPTDEDKTRALDHLVIDE